MKVELKGRNTVLTLTPTELKTVYAALDSVNAYGEESATGVYRDVLKFEQDLESKLLRAKHTREENSKQRKKK